MSRKPNQTSGRWRTFFSQPYRGPVKRLLSSYPDERSLYVDVIDLYDFDPGFADALLSNPEQLLREAETALQELHESLSQVNVRLRNHPGLLPIGRIRSRHVGEIVTVEGVVIDVDAVQARAQVATWECSACGDAFQSTVDQEILAEASRCNQCEGEGTMSISTDRSKLVDVQRLVVADKGQSGSSSELDVLLDDDIVETVSEGASIVVTGVVRLRRTGGTNRFDFVVDAIAVEDAREGRTDRESDEARDIRDLIQSRWESVIER